MNANTAQRRDESPLNIFEHTRRHMAATARAMARKASAEYHHRLEAMELAELRQELIELGYERSVI